MGSTEATDDEARTGIGVRLHVPRRPLHAGVRGLLRAGPPRCGSAGDGRRPVGHRPAPVASGVRRRRGRRSGEPRRARRPRVDRGHRCHPFGPPPWRRPGPDGGGARRGAAARDARGARAERHGAPPVRAARIRGTAGARDLVALRRRRRGCGARGRPGADRPAGSAVAARRRFAPGRLRADRGGRWRGALPRDRRHRRCRPTRRSRRTGRARARMRDACARGLASAT